MAVRSLLVLGLLIAPAGEPGAGPAPFDPASVEGVVDAKDVVPELLVEMKYSTTDNFVGKDVYGAFDRCVLVDDAAAMLKRADEGLRKMRPELRLLAYDCLRPRRVQRVFWKIVKGTPQQSYVANPNSKTGSIHNYGCAIDLTLADDTGKALDMGTKFDHFGKEAEPRHEVKMLRKGQLTSEQLANRLLLREVMIRAGFLPLANEWWHFNCASNAQTRKRFKIVD